MEGASTFGGSATRCKTSASAPAAESAAADAADEVAEAAALLSRQPHLEDIGGSPALSHSRRPGAGLGAYPGDRRCPAQGPQPPRSPSSSMAGHPPPLDSLRPRRSFAFWSRRLPLPCRGSGSPPWGATSRAVSIASLRWNWFLSIFQLERKTTVTSRSA